MFQPPYEGWDDDDPIPERVPQPPPRRYICPTCKHELALDRTKQVEKVYNNFDGKNYIRVIYQCECRPYVRAIRYVYDEAALLKLFNGFIPGLPWPRTYSEEQGGTDSLMELPPEEAPQETPNEKALSRWAWELSMVEGPDDFLLFCRGGHDDEQVRAEFRAKHGG